MLITELDCLELPSPLLPDMYLFPEIYAKDYILIVRARYIYDNCVHLKAQTTHVYTCITIVYDVKMLADVINAE